MKVVAAILAAGRGERYGGDKTQAVLRGKPLWQWSFEVYRDHPEVDAAGLVGSEGNLAALRTANGAAFVVPGGASRSASAAAGVRATSPDTEIVLLHDAARPFVTARLISDVIAAVRRSGAAAPGMPVTDTIKRLRNGAVETLDRRELYAMQTPQGASRALFLRAFAAPKADATDDLQLLEAIGINPEIVPGDPANRKVTRPEDLEEGGGRSVEIRTGLGYDVHPFSADPGRRLMLGGVWFEGESGLEGHSDADVLLHAVVDALLGASGLGDIGVHFPNTDPKWRNCESLHFLRHTGGVLKEQGWQIQNVDATVVAERPHLMTRAAEIRRNIASALGIEYGRVNVKATTNERLGFIGRGEGIASMATATLSRS